MGFVLKYGANSLAVNSVVARSITKRPEYGPRGHRIGTKETYVLQGEVYNTGGLAALTADLAALEAVFATNGGNLGLYYNDGATASVHVLTSTNCIGGVKVTDFSWLNGDGTEYTNYRTFGVTLEGFVNNPESNLIQFDETVTIQGNGGPGKVVMTTLTGPPVEQIVSQTTPYRATQSGSATGWTNWPAAPPPLWPSALINPDQAISLKNPRYDRGSSAEYTITWNYRFESATALPGFPHTGTTVPNP